MSSSTLKPSNNEVHAMSSSTIKPNTVTSSSSDTLKPSPSTSTPTITVEAPSMETVDNNGTANSMNYVGTGMLNMDAVRKLFAVLAMFGWCSFVGIWIWNCKRSKKTPTPLGAHTNSQSNGSDTITDSMDDNKLEEQQCTAETHIEQKEEDKEDKEEKEDKEDKEEKGKEASEEIEVTQQVNALKEEEEEVEIVPRRADRADSPPKNKKVLAIVKSDRRASLTQQQEVSSNSLKRSETQQLVDYSVQQTAAVLSSINPEELSTEQRMELAKVTLNIASVMQQKQSLKHKQQALDQKQQQHAERMHLEIAEQNRKFLNWLSWLSGVIMVVVYLQSLRRVLPTAAVPEQLIEWWSDFLSVGFTSLTAFNWRTLLDPLSLLSELSHHLLLVGGLLSAVLVIGFFSIQIPKFGLFVLSITLCHLFWTSVVRFALYWLLLYVLQYFSCAALRIATASSAVQWLVIVLFAVCSAFLGAWTARGDPLNPLRVTLPFESWLEVTLSSTVDEFFFG